MIASRTGKPQPPRPSERQRRAYTWRDELPPGSPRPLRGWVRHPNLAAAIAATAYVAVLVGGLGTTPSDHPVGRVFDPDSPITMTVLFLMIGWALHSRLVNKRVAHPGVFVTSLIACLALLLGVVGYWPSNKGQSTFWTALAQAANLFVGEVENPNGTLSLTLQVARVGAAIAMFSAAFTALLAATRNVWLLRKVHRESEIVLVWGLNPYSLDVVRALRAAAHPFTAIVFLEPDKAHPLKQQAQQLGAFVIGGTINSDPRNQEILSSILSHPGADFLSRLISPWARASRPGISLRAAYLLHQHDIRNIEAADVLDVILRDPNQWRADAPPRIIVRIDRVRLAQDFIRRKIASTHVLYDATGLHQMTAREVVQHVLDQQPDSVVVTGHTDLTLAFLYEWTIQCGLSSFLRKAEDIHAQHHGSGHSRTGDKEPSVIDSSPSDTMGLEQAFLNVAARDPSQAAADVDSHFDARRIPVILCHPQAGQIRERHRRLLGGLGQQVTVVAEPAAAGVEKVKQLLHQRAGRQDRPGQRSRDAVVRTELPSADLSKQTELWAEQLGDDDFTIYFPNPFAIGVSPQSLMGNLRAYGFTLTARQPGAPDEPTVEDNWLRAAKQLHRTYQALYGTESWRDLGQAKRQSNLRAIRSFLILAAEHAGRSWVPQEGCSPAPLSEAELSEIAAFEHTSWLEFMTTHCTVQGEPRDDITRVNPLLKAWGEAGPEGHERTLSSLRITQELLSVLGFQPYGRARP